MDILWLTVRMIIYGLVVGLIIGVGALCYAFISIRFMEVSRWKSGQGKGKLTLMPTCPDKGRQ